LSRASREIAADLRGRDDSPIYLRKINYVCDRPVFRYRTVNPFLDRRATVLVSFVSHAGIGCEELIEVSGLPGIVRLKERGDDWRQMCFHDVQLLRGDLISAQHQN